MNILITNDDGPKAYGLQLLQAAAKAVWPNAKIVTLTGDRPTPGMAMALSLKQDLSDLTFLSAEDNQYSMKARPADLIHVAFHRKDLFLPDNVTWDLVLCGINHGHNSGLDVLHSGTVGQAILASHCFAATSIAFAQHLGHTNIDQVETDDPRVFTNSSLQIRNLLSQLDLEHGVCWNVNFPPGDSNKGQMYVPVAHYSSWRPHNISLVPRAGEERTDVVALQQGFISISKIELQLNQALHY